MLVAVSQIRWSMNHTNINELKLLQRAIKTLQFCYFNTKSKQQGILTDFLKPLKHTITLFVLLPIDIVKEGNGSAGLSRDEIENLSLKDIQKQVIFQIPEQITTIMYSSVYNRVKAC